MGSIEQDFNDLSVKETPYKILVLGGCYAGLSAALNLLDLCKGKQARATLWQPNDFGLQPTVPVEIKIVDERDGYYHLIGSPLALADEQFAAKAWRTYDSIPALRAPEISFLQGRATNVDCGKKIATITNSLTGTASEERYDYLIVATGLRREWPTVPQSLRRKEYLSEVGTHAKAATGARECAVVIGGGAVGIEMAAELKLVAPHLNVKLIHSRDHLLSSEPLPLEFATRTATVLREAGVDLILSHRVNSITPIETEEKPLYKLTLSDGSELLAGHVISAISHGKPSTDFLPAEVRNGDGYVNVLPTMQFSPLPLSQNADSHFAIGDIIAWTGIKRCGAAMAMGHIAAYNIHQRLLTLKYSNNEQTSSHNQTGNVKTESNGNGAIETEKVGSEKIGLVVEEKKREKEIEFPSVPPMIALAVGKVAVMYGEKEGTTWGEDKMEMMFGNDLGFSICWNYLRLGYEGDLKVEEA